MERKTNLIIAFLLLICFGLPRNLGAQKEDSIFYKSYTTTNMEPWKKTMEKMAEELEPGNYKQLFEVTLAWYGYIGYCLGNDKEREARQYLKSGWQFLEQLEEMPEAGAAPHALKSGFYGFEMALARYKAVIFGPKSLSALKEAAAIDSSNVHYLVEKGNQMYYTPSVFGGDKETALRHYEKAVKTMEAGGKYQQKHWFYLNTLVTLGHTFEAAGYLKQAREVYHKIQNLEPDFKWFNEEVWPDFVKKYGYE
ncbi:MAG: hypothetical protein JG782_1591 [Anaerophaga sp.]|uniref:tetratricopeptide repeat protein n=1 Tax=Anaerophaga thermohalophila TaxID=177400 RepID=UPI000237BAE2|nr:hypothetical protein [Anaerophaga thermohalophila]MBZ4676971.1 hypothetical protein [Anaerophaga sp.]